LKGINIPKPVSGTLSGHIASEPFDKHVNELLKKKKGATSKYYFSIQVSTNLCKNDWQ